MKADAQAIPLDPWLGSLPRALLSGLEQDLLEPLSIWSEGQEVPIPSWSREIGEARPKLAPALEAKALEYGHPAPARQVEQLAEGALLVVTGQQPGLFLGPLYSLIKMIASVLWAERLEQQLGRPVVALFWVAGEDHDHDEVARFCWPGLERASGSLGPDRAPLVPVGARTLGDRIGPLLEELAAIEGSSSRGDLGLLRQSYRPELSWTDAFCHLATRLLGERCPLLLDARLEELKQLQRPVLRRLIERRVAVDQALHRRQGRVIERGFRLQVKPSSGSPLFMLDRRGQRRCIEWREEGGYGLRGADQEGEVTELLERLEQWPGDFSPGVLARPAVQDAALGTSLQVLGPGELSYMTQASALYPILDVEPPVVVLRPHALLLSRRARRLLNQLTAEGIGAELALSAERRLEEELARRRIGDPVAPIEQQILEQLEQLRRTATAMDRQLDVPWGKTSQQVQRALASFRQRLEASAARSDDVLRGRLERLRSELLPGGKLQERAVTTGALVALYGEGLAATLFDRLKLEGHGLQLIDLDEESDGGD